MELTSVVVLLGAAVIAVPIFKRLGLGSVLGYLAAGVVIGPSVLGLFHESESVLGVAELGVVMLLFIIGLELEPARLWALRRAVFGLGLIQVVVCGGLIFLAAWLSGLLAAPAAFIVGIGLALSSTAIVMQILEERGEVNEPYGRNIFAILLFQDLAIVPALAAVALLAPGAAAQDGASVLLNTLAAFGAVAVIVVIGLYLLNPLFRLLAAAEAREIMTAAALLVVLGAATLMHVGGLSMAMGAFLAGVLLSQSTFRHELKADIEPFRGLLLGLFFLGVGMSIDLRLVGQQWMVILAAVVVFMTLKAGSIYAVGRMVGGTHANVTRVAFLLAEGGEFAFVLFATAAGSGLFDETTRGVLNATVIVSMALTPLMALAMDRLTRGETISFDGIEQADGLSGTALVIGFGRFGQVASQALLANGTDVSIIDNDTDMIRAAAQFGFKIYYGDGTRLDVLRASGASEARIVAVCVDKRDAADQIVEIVKAEFPLAKLLVRSFDRGHTLSLLGAGVDFEIRETFESAMVFGRAALLALDVEEEAADEILEGVRKRDAARLELQIAEGIYAGRHLFKPTPTPLTPPRREGQALTEETAAAVRRDKSAAEAAEG
jgi:glutathione-regulated potassium-efflux system protein KefB